MCGITGTNVRYMLKKKVSGQYHANDAVIPIFYIMTMNSPTCYNRYYNVDTDQC